MFWLVGQGLPPAREPRFSATSRSQARAESWPSRCSQRGSHKRCSAHGLRVRTCRNTSHSWRLVLVVAGDLQQTNRGQCDRRRKRGPQSRSLPGVQQLTCSAASLPYSMTQNSPAYLPAIIGLLRNRRDERLRLIQVHSPSGLPALRRRLVLGMEQLHGHAAHHCVVVFPSGGAPVRCTVLARERQPSLLLHLDRGIHNPHRCHR